MAYNSRFVSPQRKGNQLTYIGESYYLVPPKGPKLEFTPSEIVEFMSKQMTIPSRPHILSLQRSQEEMLQ
jgi:hypothetical protein